ncbi:MAG: protein phosphatase 2C domain-containing protein [Lachnospiraceae bacterium]|nr:protein phosphatase 2C domain-containing protein [Lachnospiraceae bacterium]
MRIFEYSNKGSRDTNQDFIIHKSLSEKATVVVVADGMGGYSYGEIASHVIGQSIIDYVQANFDKESPALLLKESISFANDSLMLKRLSLGAKHMGAVVVVLLVIDNEAYMTWLGDSRIYIYRGGVEVYKTEDHSVINELSKIKSLTNVNLEKYSSVVTRSIMGDDNLGKVEVSHLSVFEGDVFVLCTDGFYKENVVSDAVYYDDSKKTDFDNKALMMSDNYSFAKLEI